MKDVSDKITTLRIATATACVKASEAVIAAVVSGKTPKGEVLNVARSAAILAAKRTFELIPYCHNIPIDHVDISFEPSGRLLNIKATVKAVAKTGVEMEALTAASTAALTVYDMMKPIDSDIEITSVKLLEKSGGKSGHRYDFIPSSAVLVTSDSVSSGKKDDLSGKFVAERLKELGSNVMSYQVVPDDRTRIERTIREWIRSGVQLIVTTGGTGLSSRDVTADTVSGLVERELPGISEAVRAYGQEKTPYSMLSRGVAGTIGNTIIITLPGSLKAVQESMAAIFPYIFHAYPMLEGKGH